MVHIQDAGPSTRQRSPANVEHPPAGTRTEDLVERSGGVLDYVTQSVRTGAPLVAIDLAAMWGTIGLLALAARLLGLDPLEPSISAFAALGWSLPLFLALGGLYPAAALSPADEIKRTTIGLTLLFGVHSVLSASIVGFQADWVVFVLASWVLTIWAVPAARILARSLLARFPWWGLRTLVVGFDDDSAEVFDAFRHRRTSGLRPVAFLNAMDEPGNALNAELVESEVARLARSERAFWAVFVSGSGEEESALVARGARGVPHVLVLSKTLATTPVAPSLQFFGAGMSGVQVRDNLLSPFCHVQKRILDLTVASLACLLLAPVIALIAVAIKLTSRGPVFYRHARIGKGGRRLSVLKFRTMVQDADSHLEQCLARDPELRAEWRGKQKLRKDPRVTSVGRLLRRFSLDELPQLWNVVRGEMSLVGPRPIVDDEIEKYAGAFQLYKRVMPGITGLWQVSGRNNTTYERRVHLDTYYIRNWSIWLEMHILLRTVRVVLGGEGAF